MSVHAAPSADEPRKTVRANSPWRPLCHPVFRWLWIASVVSNIGSWMHDVGDAWLMTTLSSSPLLIALVQTADSLPVFLLALPAGAIADILDRRRLLLITQAWMGISAGALGAITLAGAATPWIVLAFTFSMGLGLALNMPAWQAVVPELVARKDLPAAAALGSIGFNLARAVGPALGGLVVAAAGPGAVYVLNATSFLGVIVVLFLWKRQRRPSVLPAERLLGAIKAGVRYSRHAPAFQAVLVRTLAFSVCGSAPWALLPLVGRHELGLSPLQYGILLGCIGGGAVIGAMFLPRVRRNVSVDLLVAVASLAWAGFAVALASVTAYGLLCLLAAAGGVAWMSVMSSLNVSAQTAIPEWVRARALSVYSVALMGGMAGGAAAWGAVATYFGSTIALLLAAGGLMLGLAAMVRYHLSAAQDLDLSPAQFWPEPIAVHAPHPDEGPVLVLVEYRVDPKRAAEFAEAVRALETVRRRDGAFRWGIFRDIADPARWLETFVVESWGEHLRQHERHTVEDQPVEERVRSLVEANTVPIVTHLIWGRAPIETGRADGAGDSVGK
jgi:MFS family permease/quinol monooxygenase YgiN